MCLYQVQIFFSFFQELKRYKNQLEKKKTFKFKYFSIFLNFGGNPKICAACTVFKILFHTSRLKFKFPLLSILLAKSNPQHNGPLLSLYSLLSRQLQHQWRCPDITPHTILVHSDFKAYHEKTCMKRGAQVMKPTLQILKFKL